MTVLDPRIAEGMRAQLAARDRLVAAGGRQRGWKVGFGSPAAFAKLGTDRPLVGFLMDGNVLPDGATVQLAGWTTPVLEAEIAVHLGADLGPGAGRGEVRTAVAGVSAAIELADVDPPPEDVPTILAGDIFHRHVLLGPVVPGRTTADGVRARVLVDGTEAAATDDPAALTGELLEVVRSTAETLAACGERLRAGQVVITGAVVPPMPVAPGTRTDVELPPLGRLSVSFAP